MSEEKKLEGLLREEQKKPCNRTCFECEKKVLTFELYYLFLDFIFVTYNFTINYIFYFIYLFQIIKFLT